jgi:hypothetical protein
VKSEDSSPVLRTFKAPFRNSSSILEKSERFLYDLNAIDDAVYLGQTDGLGGHSPICRRR